MKPGDYAGAAVYRPRDLRELKWELNEAVGATFQLTYVGIAGPDEEFAGQRLFQERSGGTLRSWLAEQDLEFIEVAPPTSPRVPVGSRVSRAS